MSNTPILIIDDEPSVLEGLQEFLEDEGYDVHVTADARQALPIFRKIRPQIVVTDLRMPGVSGLEIIRQIREIEQDFVSKPIGLDQFKVSLDRARDSMQAARSIQNELQSMRDELVLTQSHLQEYLQKMADSESFALAGRLLAGVLHNLNSPLSFIMSQAQLLHMVHPEVEDLQKIEEQAYRMGKIIQSVMNKVKHSHVRQEEWLNLNHVLEDEVRFLESHPFFRHEIHKEWLLADDLPPIRGIAGDFGQVFGNLLRNAAEAMKNQNTRKLTLCTSHDGCEITIAIRDTGPGIPWHLRDRIFQPFFTTKSNEVGISGSLGTGIGLSSCKQILQQYGGSIKVMSHPGQGTTFVIDVPVSA
jgi:signal transduction histidine kinase